MAENLIDCLKKPVKGVKIGYFLWIADVGWYNCRKINQSLKKSVEGVKIGYFFWIGDVGWCGCTKFD